ncbi:MAG: hypothetical protein N3A59_07860 [Thermodesulfovibrionales bacterium]|nr:hypothetical protein [Thermodesulfovibrionales bacterium]
MIRFEELQMRLAETAKKYLKFQNLQVFIEQFSLERESILTFSLDERDYSHLYQSSASFTFDVSQTEKSLYEENDIFSSEPEYLSNVELTFNIIFPALSKYLNIENLIKELEEEYPDIEPVLITRKVFSSLNMITEHEISYTYELDIGDQIDNELIDDIFKEHKEILNFIYDKTIDYIDFSWQMEDEV